MLTRRCARSVAASIVTLGLALTAAPVGTHQQASGPQADLTRILDRGGMLQDRNEDGVVDFVDAHLVLGSAPTAGEIAAAASVAARLGFETAALTLPLRAEGRPIVIGASAMRGRALSPLAPSIDSLKPGEGVVSVADIGGAQAIVIAGRDDAGTQAAANAFAGRFPHLWDPAGPTLAEAVEEMRKVLTDRGINVLNVSIPAVVASADRIVRLVMAAEVASPPDVARSRQALNALRTPAERRRLSFDGVGAVDVRIHAASVSAVVSLAGESPVPRPRPLGRRAGGAVKEGLDLSNLYTIDGLLGDSDENLIPDRVEALLVPGAGMTGTTDLAARLGLESAGISVPIAVVPEAVTEPAEEPTLVLIGAGHPLIDGLVKDRKLDPSGLQAGEGLVTVVKKSFGEKPAVVITGGDRAGVSRAVAQVAERFPHIWERGKDRTTIDDVEEDVRTLLSGRSPSGQAATALYKLDKIAADLAGKNLESASVLVSLDKPAEGLSEFVRREASEKIKADSVQVTIDDRDVQKAKNIFTDEVQIPSEVDEFRQLLRSKVLTAVRKKQTIRLEARLSESPEIRAQLEGETRAALIRAGAADSSSVRVLSAYKQGYSWLYDEIRPALGGVPIESITIRFAEIGAPAEWKQQAMFTPTRWLLELFPIDETLARDLKLDLKQIRFERMPIGSPTYEVIVKGPGGAEVLRRTFEPKYVLRPFFDRFPDYEKVRVTTGWIRAETAGSRSPIIDQRIITDPERFWDHFQSKTLANLYDYVMRISKGKPRREDAPHFGELVVEVSLSEADYNLGIDKERISPMESIHEEVYFHTLHFVDVIGRNSRGESLDYIGRVIPIVRPKQDGKPGFARITLSGFASNRPAVIVNYKERGGRQGEARMDIPKIDLQRPSATGALVKAGSDGLQRLDLRVRIDTEKDERPSLIKRARPEQVDAQIVSAEQVSAVLANLGRLRAAGLYRDALAYHHLGAIRVTAAWAHDPDPKTELTKSVVSNGTPPPFPDIKKLLPASYRSTGAPLVQWDTPIPPGEAAEILAKMSTFPEATVYKVGQSYLGKDLWAMDLLPPTEGTHLSQAKMTTLKPTIVYSGRQDANEVSSTSHILKLAELLLTDPEFKAKLKKVNVVIHPITNADGAQLAYDLYKITPDHMLHAGYLGPLGVSLVSRWDSDPIYPESRVRPKLWRTWLPDVFLNPHGYPSHEWVQLFSEYGGWVRNRVTEARDWQQMRGWFIPGFNYVDDPKYPRHKDAAMRIRELITEHINAVPAIREFNQRAYDRYRRYGHEHNPEDFRMDVTSDVLIYTALKGNRGDTGTRNMVGDDYMVRRPNVTIFFGSTEAPDETAYGDYMKFVATMGLQWDKANLEYLFQGKHVVERKVTAFFGGVSLSALRARPPKPEAKTSVDPAPPVKR
ncbi:MAG: M14 family metallopeptidase [Vicinamibacterales bacterium]